MSGQNNDQITYNQFSPLQWTAGFCRAIREVSDFGVKEHILEYVINLLGEAMDFLWAKASHAVLFCQMGQGEIVGWSDNDNIDIESEGLMHSDTSHKLVQMGQIKKVLARRFHVFSLIKTHVCKRTHIRQGGSL